MDKENYGRIRRIAAPALVIAGLGLATCGGDKDHMPSQPTPVTVTEVTPTTYPTVPESILTPTSLDPTPTTEAAMPPSPETTTPTTTEPDSSPPIIGDKLDDLLRHYLEQQKSE